MLQHISPDLELSEKLNPNPDRVVLIHNNDLRKIIQRKVNYIKMCENEYFKSRSSEKYFEKGNKKRYVDGGPFSNAGF